MTRHARTGALVVVVLVLVAAALAVGRLWGAAGDDRHAASPTVSALAGRASATDHVAADVRFARQMTPHHTQATQMARLARTRAGSPRVAALAADIAAAQAPEIITMRGWLRDWGAATSADGDGDMSSMTGMASPSEMSALAELSGGGFDRAFLRMMTEHHTGAVSMARTELARGRSAGALALAASVEVTQRAEIVQMRALLDQG